jgi:hypothetical protein
LSLHEEFMPTNDLAVFRILHLKPRSGPAVGLIRAAAPFCDDILAGDAIQIAATLSDAVDALLPGTP